ncbi:hypothetical protein [Scytonema hofmannii]
MLPNGYKDIHLFRFDNRIGNVYEYSACRIFS